LDFSLSAFIVCPKDGTVKAAISDNEKNTRRNIVKPSGTLVNVNMHFFPNQTLARISI